jgi:nickel/cobalt transporter (NicO) family protein
MRERAPSWTARGLWLPAAFAAFAVFLPGLAAAHPMGNFSINHYAAIAIGPGQVELRYLIDMAEIPTFQEMREADFAADPSDPRLASYLRQKLSELRAGLIVELNGRRLALHEIAHDVIFPPGAGGLPTMKLAMRLAAPVTPGEGGAVTLDYRDLNFPGRAGWKEVIAIGKDGVRLAASSVPDRDRSAELGNYPVDLLNSPPQVLEAHLRPVLVASDAASAGAQASEPVRLSLRPNRIGTPRNAFTQLMAVQSHGHWFLLTAALIAIVLGAMHALEPGHGKTVVAAYLVGSRGTARHALMLAATVTASHTAGVYVLGALTLYASRWIIPERIYPWLGAVSGLIVAVLGAGLFARRLMTRVAHVGSAPDHDHGHDHHHVHEHPHEHSRGHHDHSHFHPHRHDIFGRHIDDCGVDGRAGAAAGGDSLPLRDLLALGISGGIVPCPAALVVLLSALSLNRAGFGLFLIVAFSAGLAAVLIGFGLSVVYARRLVARHLRVENNFALRWLPLLSSAVITVAGVAITLQALASGGVISPGR